MSETLRQSLKLQRLIVRRDQLAARIQSATNRSARNESKKDTRRKIIVGRFFQRQHIYDGTEKELRELLDRFLIRFKDREIFGLNRQAPALSLDDLPLRGVILIGALYLKRYREQGKETALAHKIEPILKKSIDRKLFGLTPNPL